jgi:hypothetical protein
VLGHGKGKGALLLVLMVQGLVGVILQGIREWDRGV